MSHWRDELLTRGEVHDILMKVAEDIEESYTKPIGKQMTRLLKLHLVKEMVESAAKSLSKEDWERCPGWLTKTNTAGLHSRCEYGPCQHQDHYIPPEVSDGV